MKDRLARQLRHLVDAQRRTQVAVDSMASGSLAGRTVQAAPLPERPKAPPYRPGPSSEIAVFSTAGVLEVTDASRTHEVIVGGRSLYAVFNLTDDVGVPATLTGDTDVDVLVNGTVEGTVTVASGDSRGVAAIAQAVEPGDLITLSTTAVGTGGAYGSVQVRVLR